MKLKHIILESRDPGPKFVHIKKNHSLIFTQILKNNRTSILKNVSNDLKRNDLKDIIEICHRLNSVFSNHQSKFPCKIYFSDPDPKNWKIRGYSKILKNPCFNVCHFADENTTFYEKTPHIVLEITNNFIECLRNKDYLTLQLNVSRGLGHEIIHYLQHKKMGEYSTKMAEYYNEPYIRKKYASSMDHENIDSLIKDWTRGEKTNSELRKNFCKNYMCCSVELCPQAFSCFSDFLFYEKIRNPKISKEELKDKTIKSLENETVFKSRVMKIFKNVAKELQPRQFNLFKEFCLQYCDNDFLFEFIE